MGLMDDIAAQKEAQRRSQFPAVDGYVGGLIDSAVQSAGELIGREKPLATQMWEKDHPISAIVTNFGVPFGYFGAALKVGRMGRMGKFIDAIGEDWHPVLRYAAREAARMAPAEALRLGITGATGGDWEETALDGILNIGLSAGLGAGFGVFEAAGKSLRRRWDLPSDGADYTAPKQLQGRTLLDKLPTTTDPALLDGMNRTLANWKKDILLEAPGKGGVFNKDLEKGSAREIGRAFFKFKPEGKITTRQLVKGGNGYANPATLEMEKKAFGLPENWEFHVQHPRITRALDTKSQSELLATVDRNFSRVADSTWVTQERGGLYVMAKRGTGKDTWLTFKTDNPRFWVKDDLLGKIEDKTAWLRQPSKAELAWRAASPTLGQVRGFRDAVPLAIMTEDVAARSVNAWTGKLAKMTSKYLGYGDANDEAIKRIRGFFDRYLAPGIHQFNRNPIARYIMSGTRATFDHVNARHAQYMIGTKQFTKEQNLFLAAAKGAKPTGGIQELVEALDHDDLQTLSGLMYRGQGLKEGEALGISDSLKTLLTHLEGVDTEVLGELQALQQLTGVRVTKALRNHFMIQRTYKGEFFGPIYEGNRIVGIAGADTRGAVEKEAAAIVAHGAERGRTWEYRGDIVRRGENENGIWRRLSVDPEDMILVGEAREKFGAHQPKFWTERKDLKAGFVGDSRKAFTKQDLTSIISSHLHQNMKYIGEMASKHEFADLLGMLAQQDSAVFRQVEERFNDLVGIKNTADRWQNQRADEVLAPIFGSNSASKIVRGFNEYIYYAQLGLPNFAFPVINMLQAIQTVAPEIAFLKYGSREGHIKYYDNMLVGGADGNPRAVIGALSPLKLLARGFKIMGNPISALGKEADEYYGVLNRALGDGTLEPRMVEEFIGPTARLPVKLRDVVKEPSSSFAWLKQVASFGPEASERITRMHAFTTAYDLGKNTLGLQDDALYRFAKKFTTRTMFGYAVSDRPRAFTGPFGSALGLFKNWQMHYVYNWMDYLGEGFSRNEWRPLLWATAGPMALGGAAAAGPGYAIADGMSKLLTDKTLMDNWYSWSGRDPDQANWSDAIYMGLPAFLPPLLTAGYVPGVALTGTVATPFTDPSRDISMLTSFVYWDRMKAAGQAVGAMWDQAESTGKNPLRSEQVQGLLLRAFAPKSIYRTQQTLSDGIINSSTSINPSLSGLTPMETFLFRAGFNPNNVELGMRASQDLWAEKDKHLAQIQGLGAAWAEAQLAGDWEMLGRIQRRAMVEGVDFSRVMRSASSRMSAAQEDVFDRSFSAQRVSELRQSGVLR